MDYVTLNQIQAKFTKLSQSAKKLITVRNHDEPVLWKTVQS